MKFVLIPPGEFQMGATPEEIESLLGFAYDQKRLRRYQSEGPRHPVRLTKAFYLGAFEVTQEQYQSVMGTNPSSFASTGRIEDDRRRVAGQDTRSHPVDTINWFDAVQFCIELSKREDLRPFYLLDGTTVKMVDGNGYRLPTEAEWEYSCRAGSTSRMYFGEDRRELKRHAWFDENSEFQTHRVGLKLPNRFGLFDMYGNVREWCQDWYATDYYQHSPLIDPQGPPTGTERVLRCSDWQADWTYCHSSHRLMDPPDYRPHDGGFRVVLYCEDKLSP